MTPQALVSLGHLAKRNETGVFVGVTGKASRLAPPVYVSRTKGPVQLAGAVVSVLDSRSASFAQVRSDHTEFLTSMAVAITVPVRQASVIVLI
jgi:hypothetical protein